MFVRAIFLVGFLLVTGALALGTLVSGDASPSGPAVGQPPAWAIEEAATPETPAPTKAPEITATASPVASERADFTGTWTVLYTITDGAGAGQSYSFDVSLEQDGRRVSGGNDGVRVDGTAEGRTVTLTYRQPALGYTATFTWTLVNGSWGGGAFTSAVNAGTSLLQRVR